MAAPRKYSEELRERATRMALEAIADPATKHGAIRRIAAQLDAHPGALPTWVRTAEVDAGKRPGVPTDVNERLAQLARENRELRRANEILRTSAAFFAAAELDRKIKQPLTTKPRSVRCRWRWSSTTSITSATVSLRARSSESSRSAGY